MSAAAHLNLAEFRADESWKTAGRLWQGACAAFAEEAAPRDAAGRFAHKPTPAYITMKALRYAHGLKLPEPILTAEEISALTMPPQVLTIEVVGAGCGNGDKPVDPNASGDQSSEIPGHINMLRSRQELAGNQSGPHPAFTPPPSAAHASRTGRAACLIVLLVAVATACIFNDTVAAAVSAGPIPLLWHGLVGRFA
jgi:hypothetical protein